MRHARAISAQECRVQPAFVRLEESASSPYLARTPKAGLVLVTFGRYVIGGLAATITHMLVLMLLVERFGVNPSLATSIGFCIAVVVNYNFQYHWTFSARGSHAKTFSRYLVVTFAMLGVNLALFWLLTHSFQIPYLYAQLGATGVIMFCNFAINKLYTFNH